MAKTLIGTVSSNKGDKTIVVSIRTRKTHPIYKKQYISTKRMMAHDEKNEARAGDRVAISETRPISSNKRFKLAKIIERPIISEDQSVEAITKEQQLEEEATVKNDEATKKTSIKAKRADPKVKKVLKEEK